MGSHSVLSAQGMSALGSVECHNEHRMLGPGTWSLRQGQSTGEELAEGEGLAGICVIPEGMAVDESLREAWGDSVRMD